MGLVELCMDGVRDYCDTFYNNLKEFVKFYYNVDTELYFANNIPSNTRGDFLDRKYIIPTKKIKKK